MIEKNTIILFYPLVDKKRQVSNLPFPILNLERMVRGSGLRVILLDERINPDYEDIIQQNKDTLLFAGVSAMIGYQMISGAKFSETIKKHSQAPIVWGGWYANVLPELLLELNFVDFVVIGQGEMPFKELSLALKNADSTENISGLGFKTPEGYRINEKAVLIDEKTFPKVDYSLIDINAIIESNGIPSSEERSINYIATTGCPYDCSFCCLATIWGKKFYAKEVSVILNDLLYFIESGKIKKIAFDDDNFFGNKNFVKSLCQGILEKGITLLWEANAHVSTFLKNYSTADIELIYKAGCRAIRLGAESGDQDVLTRVNKRLEVSDNYEIVKLLGRFNIKPVFYIMVAFPWNPDRDFRLTLDMVGKAKILNSKLEAGINFFVPLPKTQLYDIGIQFGFTPFKEHYELVDFINKEYVAPWWKHDYRKELYSFLRVYFKYANPAHYKSQYGLLKFMSFFATLFLYPISYLRLKYGFRKFPVDAYLYFAIRKLYNAVTGWKSVDDEESMARTRSWKR